MFIYRLLRHLLQGRPTHWHARRTIAGVDTYVSEPPSAAWKILLFFADVFISLRATSVADASIGFTVLGLDYFFDDKLEMLMKQPGFVREAWRDKVVPQARECTPRWVQAVRACYGLTRLYHCIWYDVSRALVDPLHHLATGYCFGAPYVFTLANDPTFNLAVGAVAHPSDIYDGTTTQLKSELIENCVVSIAFVHLNPTLCSPSKARRQTEDILVENKAHYYIQILSGISHGFGTRGDPADTTQRFAKEECARGFLHWFNRFAA